MLREAWPGVRTEVAVVVFHREAKHVDDRSEGVSEMAEAAKRGSVWFMGLTVGCARHALSDTPGASS